MNYLVLDLETGIHNRGEDSIGKMKAAPWHPKNKVVLSGHRTNNLTSSVIRRDLLLLFPDINRDISQIVVGHNIKFDIHYLMQHRSEFADLTLPRICIWDTQLAEYILSGQRKMYPTLDYCSEKYGGTLKDDVIKDFWNNGVDTEEIPRELLDEYLENDVKNTELVYLSQVVQAEEMNMMPLMLSQMKALKATIEMEFNGMHFDKAKASSIADTIRPERDELIRYINGHLACYGIELPNYNSAAQIAALIYGGTIVEEVSVPKLDDEGKQVMYKSGARKGSPVFRKEKAVRTLAGITCTPPEFTDTGKISVSDGPLSKIDHDMPRAILKLRGLSKDLVTYYEGYSNLVWPTSSGRGVIHHSLNHCSTGTGRLSSTSPNLQNTTG